MKSAAVSSGKDNMRSIAYREHLEQGLLRDDKALELLLLLDRHVGDLFKDWVVGVNDWSILNGHFVEETVIRRWSDAEVATIVTFRGLPENVCRRVPEYAFP